MSLSPIKQEILETMLLNETPLKATEIAKEAKKEFQPVMMHLLGLTRMGYVMSPQKGLYIITTQGKKALGVNEVSKEKANQILAYATHDKSFNFYKAVDTPLNIHAHNLRDFTAKIDKVDLASLEFHFGRGDFEAWFKGLGDEELAKKMALLKKHNPQGEDVREELHEVVGRRYRQLAQLTGQVFPEDEQENASVHEHSHTHGSEQHSHEHTHNQGHEDDHKHEHDHVHTHDHSGHTHT
jgi:hypothetical protein